MTATTIVINDVEPRRQYTAAAGQVTFDFPIPFFDDGDLEVYLTPAGQTADDAADLLTITTEYTVAGANTQDGGKITLVTPATAGDIITIERIVDIDRLADYQVAGDLLAETLNKEQDTEIMISQQLRQDIDRSIKRAKSSTSGADLTLPEPSAGKAIGWTAGEDGLENLAGSVNAENIVYTPAGTGAQNTDVQTKLREFVSVKDFGAVGDGITDDTSAIQAAIDHAFSQGDPFPKIIIPNGTYIISSELNRAGNGNFVDIEGYGKRCSVLKASGTSFNSVLYLADSTDVAGRTKISNLTIDCNSIADYGVDAQSMRNWILENCEFKNAVIAGVRGGNWATTIIGNEYSNCPIGFFLQGIVTSPGSANGFTFTFNYVTDCPVGFQTDDVVYNDITISNNVFDTCSSAGIWIQTAARNCTIDKNYFESCGKTTTVTVETSGGTETIAAPIVLSHDSSTLTATFAGDIRNNYFVTNNTSRLVVAYNLERLSVLNNNVLQSDVTTAFLELREQGSANSESGGVEIKGHYPNISQLVALNALSARDNHINICVDNQALGANRKSLFFVNNPKLGMFTGGTTINETWYGGFKEFEFDAVADGTSIDRVITIDFTTLTDHPLLGRYIRVHYMTKGSVADTGVRCRIAVSGSNVIDLQITGTSYVTSGRGMTVHIPTSATSLEIRLDSLSNSANSKMIGFCVCDAAYPINNYPIAQA